jgi:hypothetical protein
MEVWWQGLREGEVQPEYQPVRLKRLATREHDQFSSRCQLDELRFTTVERRPAGWRQAWSDFGGTFLPNQRR